jgi:alkylation response protein AidB-like acyl-CoA dehydrogenase
VAVSAVPQLSDIVDAIGAVVDTTVAPAAHEVDRTGAYPRTDVEALAAAGALGLISAPEVGARDTKARRARGR